jgi:Tfp pilus assembly protein PilO
MTPVTKNYLGTSLVALGIFILYAFGWNYFSRVQIYNTAIAKSQTDLTEKTLALEKIGKLNEEYKTRRASILIISSLIPTKKSAAELISSIEQISNAVGVRISKLLLSDIKGNTTNEYNTVNIEISTGGNYQALATLLSALERNDRLLDVSKLSVSRDIQNPQVLTYKITASAYYLKDNATNNK